MDNFNSINSQSGNMFKKTNQSKESIHKQFEKGGTNLKKGTIDVAMGTAKIGFSLVDVSRRCVAVAANMGMSIVNLSGGIYSMAKAQHSSYRFQKTNQQEFLDNFERYEEGKSRRFDLSKQSFGDALKQTKKIFSKNIPNAGNGGYKLAVGSMELGKGTFQVSTASIQSINMMLSRHRKVLDNENTKNYNEISSTNIDISNSEKSIDNAQIAPNRKLGFDNTGERRESPSTELGKQFSQDLLTNANSQRSMSHTLPKM